MDDLKIKKYRDFYALQRGKSLLVCPETGNPCCSECVFFRMCKDKDNYSVVLSCRHLQLHFIIGV